MGFVSRVCTSSMHHALCPLREAEEVFVTRLRGLSKKSGDHERIMHHICTYIYMCVCRHQAVDRHYHLNLSALSCFCVQCRGARELYRDFLRKHRQIGSIREYLRAKADDNHCGACTLPRGRRYLFPPPLIDWSWRRFVCLPRWWIFATSRFSRGAVLQWAGGSTAFGFKTVFEFSKTFFVGVS